MKSLEKLEIDDNCCDCGYMGNCSYENDSRIPTKGCGGPYYKFREERDDIKMNDIIKEKIKDLDQSIKYMQKQKKIKEDNILMLQDAKDLLKKVKNQKTFRIVGKNKKNYFTTIAFEDDLEDAKEYVIRESKKIYCLTEILKDVNVLFQATHFHENGCNCPVSWLDIEELMKQERVLEGS